MFLLCFKVLLLMMINQQSPYSLHGAVPSLNSLGKKIKTSKQGLGKGVIHTLSDFLQRLVEFQGNFMQLSHFKSKSEGLLRFPIFLLAMSSDPPCTLGQAGGLGQAACCCWVSPALIREVTCQDVQDSHLPFLPLLWFSQGLGFWLGHLRIYIERNYMKTSEANQIVSLGKPQIFQIIMQWEIQKKKVILVLKIWEFCGTEQWGVLLNGQISTLRMRFLRDLKMSCVECLRFLLLHV